MPDALIVSPREEIRQSTNISIQAGLPIEQSAALERRVEAGLDVSALVVPVGGVGVYPTMIMRTTDRAWLTSTIAHEWTNNYLTLHPLGLLYERTPELRTMNETTADIVGAEVGAEVVRRYYSGMAVIGVPDLSRISFRSGYPDPHDVDPPPFDFRAAMHTTRVTADALLASGRIIEAEVFCCRHAKTRKYRIFLPIRCTLGIAVLDLAHSEDVGFSKFISMGNKADISDEEIMQALAEDENTKVILGYIEGVRDGKKFVEIPSQVSKKKPLIILKSGITSAGVKAASSHTGALAGRETSFEAAFKQSGVIRANTVGELFNYALAFANQPLPQGPNIAILTNSGGPGIIAADACDRAGLQLVPLHKETVDELRKFLPPFASFYNPVDILGDATAERYEKALYTVVCPR